MASPFCFLISELPTIWKLAFRPKMLGILITIKLVKTGETSQSIYKGVIIAQNIADHNDSAVIVQFGLKYLYCHNCPEIPAFI